MTSTLRAQAAAAARSAWAQWSFYDIDPDADRDCSGGIIPSVAFEKGYLLGHAAGVSEGARRFAEAIQKDYSGCVYKKTWRLANACHRVLSSLAPGTGLETGDGQKEEGKP